ncbi:MAG: hypothetical protein ABL994_24090, partial [Verrucomicrobiales bacterium]
MRSRVAADAHLSKTVESLKFAFIDQSELVRAAEAIRELDVDRLSKAEAKVLELLATDRTAAGAYFTSTYLPLRREQDKLLENFRSLTEKE